MRYKYEEKGEPVPSLGEGARRIGSQIRQHISYTDCKVLSLSFGQAIIQNGDTKEVWGVNDTHAGYTLQIGRWGYEFMRDYNV